MLMQVSYKKQFILGIMLLLILLVVIEGVIRLGEYLAPPCKFLENEIFKNMDPSFAKQVCFDSNQVLWSKEKPVLFHYPNQHYPTLNINEYGFRGSEIQKEKPSDVYRIFVVGGSTAFGSGATSDETTIPGYLQEIINQQNFDYDIEVINGGIGSANSETELLLVKNTILGFEPNLIIIYDGINDAVHRPVFIYDKNEKNNESPWQLIEIELEKIFIRTYRTPTILYYTVFNDPNLRFNFPNLDSVTDPTTVSKWKTHLLEICELGKNEGFSTVIVVQPIVGSGNKPLTKNELKFTPVNERSLGTVGTLKAMANSLADMESYCTKTADFTNIFDGIEDPVFYDMAHMSDFGNEIIAENLYQLISTIIINEN